MKDHKSNVAANDIDLIKVSFERRVTGERGISFPFQAKKNVLKRSDEIQFNVLEK